MSKEHKAVAWGKAQWQGVNWIAVIMLVMGMFGSAITVIRFVDSRFSGIEKQLALTCQAFTTHVDSGGHAKDSELRRQVTTLQIEQARLGGRIQAVTDIMRGKYK